VSGLVAHSLATLLAPALTAAVVVAPPPPAPPGSDDGCPSARQVGEAMQARFPGSLIAPDVSEAAQRPDALRSVLDVAGDGTVVRFSLVDARGETQLRRTLPAPGRGRPPSECLALADTVAVIVERYLSGIAYDPADTVPPETRGTAVVSPPAATAAAETGRGGLVLVGLGWRMPRGAGGEQGEMELRVGGQLELTRAQPRLSLGLSIGASPALEATLEPANGSRTLTFRRFPFRLGALLELPAGPGWVEPTAELAADLFLVSSTAGRTAPASQQIGVGYGVEAAVGYRLKIAGPLYLRPRASIGVAVKRYQVGVVGEPGPLFSTPRAYASFGIDTGVLFR